MAKENSSKTNPGASSVLGFHHVCLVVSDMERSLALYRDTLGLSVYIDAVIPDAQQALFAQKTLDDIFHVHGAKSRMVMLASPSGAKIELQQPQTPSVQTIGRKALGYGLAGIAELAFGVTEIESWFERIRTAGYETQTEYVWSVGGGRLKSFLFYDADGNMMQLCEEFDVSASA